MTRSTTTRSTQQPSQQSNLFGVGAGVGSAYSPSASANASNYNPYNSQATRSALSDAAQGDYWSGKNQIELAKEAASFGAGLGTTTSAAQSANNAAAAASSQQQQQLQNTRDKLSVFGQGMGTPAFGGQQPQAAKQDIFGRPLGTRENMLDQMRMAQEQNRLQNYSAALQNQYQMQALNKQSATQYDIADLQGQKQIEAAKIAANAQLGAAGIGAQSQMVSSLFGSLGNMVSSIGGGGRHTYW